MHAFVPSELDFFHDANGKPVTVSTITLPHMKLAGCINRFASVSWKSDFIINYDIEYRMSRDAKGEED